MKNIYLLISFLMFCLISKAQFPVQQNSGSPQTLKKELGAIGGDKGVIVGKYNDTTSANAGYIKAYPGALIITGDTLRVRNNNATKWLYAGISTGGGGGSYGIDSSAFRVARRVNDSSFILKSMLDSTIITLSSVGGGSYSGIDSSAFRVIRQINDTSFILKSLLDSTVITISGNGGGGSFSGIDSAAFRIVRQVNDSSFIIKSIFDSTIIIFSGGGGSGGNFDTTYLYTQLAKKFNITDTLNKWVNRVEQPVSNVLRFFKGASYTDFTLPSGGGGSGVTSVGATIGGGALSISGSPITTSGTLAFSWNSDNTKQVLGDGSLVDRITNNNQLTNGAGYITTVPPQTWASITGKPSLFSGDYNDLTNKPTIPTAIDTTNKWINRVEQPTSNVLRFFKGSSYNDFTLPSGGGSVTALDSILNVNTSGKKQGSQILWDAVSSKWIAKTPDTVALKLPLKIKKTTGQKDTMGLWLPPYTIAVNNTSDSAFATFVKARYFSERDYTDTIIWTGTTAPSGTSVIRWGGLLSNGVMNLFMTANYQNEGAGISAITVRLPSGAPQPLVMSGVQVYSGVMLYPANMVISRANGSTQRTPGSTSPALLVFSTDTSKFDITASFSSSSVKTIIVQVSYMVASP